MEDVGRPDRIAGRGRRTDLGTLAGMKFLIVDDHPMLRDGVAAVLRQFDPQACAA